MTGGTEARALIRWKECAEITASVVGREGERPGTGKGRILARGSASGGRLEGSKELGDKGSGEEDTMPSNATWEGGLTQKTESGDREQRHTGNAQPWQ